MQLVSSCPVLIFGPLCTGEGEEEASEMQICSCHPMAGIPKTRVCGSSFDSP